MTSKKENNNFYETPPFNKAAVKKLIKLRGEKYKHYFLGKRNNHSQGWQIVINEMGPGYELRRTKKKWENLMYKYKNLKSAMSDELVVSWEFYSQMDKICSENPPNQSSAYPFPSNPSSPSVNTPVFVDIGKSSPQSIASSSNLRKQQSPSQQHYNNGDYQINDESNLLIEQHLGSNNDIQEVLEYFKKRDKKFAKQQKTIISLLKRVLEHKNISVLISSDSEEEDI